MISVGKYAGGTVVTGTFIKCHHWEMETKFVICKIKMRNHYLVKNVENTDLSFIILIHAIVFHGLHFYKP